MTPRVSPARFLHVVPSPVDWSAMRRDAMAPSLQFCTTRRSDAQSEISVSGLPVFRIIVLARLQLEELTEEAHELLGQRVRLHGMYADHRASQLKARQVEHPQPVAEGAEPGHVPRDHADAVALQHKGDDAVE